MVVSGERVGGGTTLGQGSKIRVIIGLDDIMCVQLLKIIKHHKI